MRRDETCCDVMRRDEVRARGPWGVPEEDVTAGKSGPVTHLPKEDATGPLAQQRAVLICRKARLRDGENLSKASGGVADAVS